MRESTIGCVRYVAEAYRHLIPFNTTMSGAEYGAKIAENYDTENPAVYGDVWYAKTYIEKITRYHDRTEWTYTKAA